MIDSILERPHRRITLDRILLDKDTLTTDPSEIEDHAINHYQHYVERMIYDVNNENKWHDEYQDR